MNNLIFLPGASGSISFWYPLIKKLPQYYRTKIIGYPGFGDTAESLDVKSFKDLTNYVLNQINEESIIVAQSMGGIFAVTSALQKPQLVKGLVLIATSGGINLEPFNVQDWREAYRQAFLKYPDWFITTNANYEEFLSDINIETLLIGGDNDPVSPVQVGQYLNQKFENSTLYVVKGGDHQLAEKYADEVAVQIKNYLKGLM
ncbi:alpha/beta fold hydrolase [Acinetobacter baumannii]|uniref:alpha/beta fold hydrolase n=3 Tax=Acinetobacter baumannii TaxID=470 RepID=UPI0013B3C1E0|nr:alpha/beta hydrolase [Acinetobacter baumannii]EKU0795911.1 alpha/beta fold hydrolase [Acinetobacter baumannii]EKX8606476.1 alpha/beta fold hydrolase [Acinetobacter baumannii]MBK5998898.1 alpha/beta fold hydrolase [Acinetobacter baumannii]MBK6038864.1 alpha/beta fold hydrolase [Acinetobacter baumannii]MBK6049623.1 alpha/beta fold hydrolase [Acinetobacter baumannii]